MTGHQLLAAVLAFTPWIALLTSACELKDPCSPGQTPQNGFCIEGESGGSGGASGSGGVGTGGAASGAAGEGAAGDPGAGSGGQGGGLLGDPCTASDQCSKSADYCAIQPGKTEGYCSPTDCHLDASLCPSDAWRCEEQFMAFGVPSFCMPK